MLAVSKYGNCRSRRATDARKLMYFFNVSRKYSSMITGDQLRRPVQISSAGVITEAAPLCEHLVKRGRCKASDIGKALQKAKVIRDYGRYLSLLQHDFR